MEKDYMSKGKQEGKCKSEHQWEYGHWEKESPAGKYWDSFRNCRKCGRREGIMHNRFIHDT